MKKIFLLGLSIALVHWAQAQNITGRISDTSTSKPIPGANVYWSGTTSGTATDVKGDFDLPVSLELPHNLVVSFVGYQSDTVLVSSQEASINVALRSSMQIGEVEIAEEREVFEMSAASQLNTETINRGILRKAACCNLSESFETSASVDVVLNDAVTGTRKIQMLGLEGIYVQKLFEGIPFNRGLGNVLGFDQIPGPWINSIQLTKGVGTVQNGYESQTGMINLNFIPPDGEEQLYLDFFANSQSRFEANAVWTKKLVGKWSTALFINGNTQQQKVDRNDDGFLDMPLREGAKVMNRWKYKGDFFRSQIMASYTNEQRTAGQEQFDFDDDFGNTSNYGFGIDYEQVEAFAKIGILSKLRQDRSLGTTININRTWVDSYFGNTSYVGKETSISLSSRYQTKLSEYSDHSLNIGASYLYDEYAESYADSAFSRIENVPGVQAEYTYERPRFTVVAGLRSDFHNLYGTQISPRLHLKYNLKPLSAVRATLGRGFRAPNAFADQLGVLASSRVVRVLQTPDAEQSWNTGVSFLHKFELFNRTAVFNTDYYYTIFENQLVVDRDNSPNTLLFYNLQGKSFAHSFQTDFQTELIRGLAAKVSYKFQQVRVDYLSGERDKPFVPRHRALFNIGYTSHEGKWYFDFTANWYGSQRIADTGANPREFQLDERSEDYFLFNTQITRVFNNFEVYVGSENLGNFIQEDAIIDPENPFGNNFDATLIYGPLNGRTFYLGVRLNLKTNKS